MNHLRTQIFRMLSQTNGMMSHQRARIGKAVYTVFHKNWTPKAGRHKFIKISLPKMIFHTVHCHSVADSSCLKSLVWAEYQLHSFHGNKSRLVKVWADLEQTIVDEAIDQWRKRLKACVKVNGQHFEHLL